MKVRIIEINNGSVVQDFMGDTDEIALGIRIDAFCKNYDAKELTNAEDFSHYISENWTSFLGVYFL